MSRVAKAPVKLPNGVEYNIKDDVIHVKGPKGELSMNTFENVDIIVTENDGVKSLSFSPREGNSDHWAITGTARALLNNMVTGVSAGYKKVLELVGVGYRAQLQGNCINLSLGFSHPVSHALPTNVVAEIPNNTTIVLSSIDKQLLGQTAAEIRAYRPPEPYKGKGIRYAGEHIVRKETKKK